MVQLLLRRKPGEGATNGGKHDLSLGAIYRRNINTIYFSMFSCLYVDNVEIKEYVLLRLLDSAVE